VAGLSLIPNNRRSKTMGCDIHTMAERGFEHNGKTYWTGITDPVFDHDFYDPERPVAGYNYPYTTEPYGGRNYRLFAFLADVRNGRGFAGIDTGNRITPIADPRGVPEDASDEWKKCVEEWGADMHSTSWFTLAELKAADWDRGTVERGVIAESHYLELKAGEFAETPRMWSGSVQGGGSLTVTPELYEAGARGERSTYVSWQWEDTMRDNAKWFLDHTIPGLERNAPRLGEHPGFGVEDTRPIDETKIRLVFGFDN
jgi:hypothetical protein